MLDDHNRPENLSLEVFTSEKYQRDFMQETMGIVTCYRKEFKLLFLHSQDSRFEDYWERWIDKSTTIGLEYMEKMKELCPKLNTRISPFFIHFISTWWISMIREVVLHEELSLEEIECFIGEYIRYSTGGWEKLMNTGHKREKQMIEHRNSSYVDRIKTIRI